MKIEPNESIASSLRILVWILVIQSAVGIFLAVLTSLVFFVYVVGKEPKSSQVVAAAEDIPAGTILTSNNLGRKTFLKSDLKTDDWVSPADGDVLYGHRLLNPVSRLTPIEWHNTDIVITNQGSPQQPPPN